jgi:hypothetical protein
VQDRDAFNLQNVQNKPSPWPQNQLQPQNTVIPSRKEEEGFTPKPNPPTTKEASSTKRNTLARENKPG